MFDYFFGYNCFWIGNPVVIGLTAWLKGSTLVNLKRRIIGRIHVHQRGQVRCLARLVFAILSSIYDNRYSSLKSQ
jgi:hypothetical protein